MVLGDVILHAFGGQSLVADKYSNASKLFVGFYLGHDGRMGTICVKKLV